MIEVEAQEYREMTEAVEEKARDERIKREVEKLRKESNGRYFPIRHA